MQDSVILYMYNCHCTCIVEAGYCTSTRIENNVLDKNRTHTCFIYAYSSNHTLNTWARKTPWISSL